MDNNKSVTHTREYVRKSRSGDQERTRELVPPFLVPRSIIDRVKIVTLAGYNLRAMRRAKLNESSMKRVESPDWLENQRCDVYVFNASKVCETQPNVPGHLSVAMKCTFHVFSR